MCTHSRYIYNPYRKERVLVSCGKCEACLQEKANSLANRIKNNVSSGQITLFCTFTYANDFVPYVLKSDLKSSIQEIPVYRRADIRYIYDKKNGYRLKKEDGIHTITNVFIPVSSRLDGDIIPLKHLRGLSSDHVGVCLNYDFQCFIKRLKQYLIRKEKYDSQWSYMYCSEYGSITHRPHFHALIFCEKDAEAIFRDAISACWSYANRNLTKDYILLARDAASYVSSYVSGSYRLPSILQENVFRQKHAFSLGFGVNCDCFSLPSILQKIRERNLVYYVRKEYDGESCTAVLPIPAYCINRYFPKFKGFGVLPESALLCILREPEKVFELSDVGYVKSIHPNYEYSTNECYHIYVALENAYQRFNKLCGLNRFDFARYHLDAWSVYYATLYRLLLKDKRYPEDFTDFYENVIDISFCLVCCPDGFDLERAQLNPNARSDIVSRTINLSDLYYKKDKSRKVSNFVMQYHHDV